MLHPEGLRGAVVAIEPDYLPNHAPTRLPFDVDNEIDGLPDFGLDVGEGCLRVAAQNQVGEPCESLRGGVRVDGRERAFMTRVK